MNANSREIKKIGNWLLNGDTGSSSEALCGMFLGGETKYISYPHDPSDLNRCVKFLDCVDESKRYTLIFYMGTKSKQWKAISDNWIELMKLYKKECRKGWGRAPMLYEKMKEIGL